jgi:hypothetical protein
VVRYGTESVWRDVKIICTCPLLEACQETIKAEKEVLKINISLSSLMLD